MSLEKSNPSDAGWEPRSYSQMHKKVVAAYNQVNAKLDSAFDELATPMAALL